MTSIKSPEPPIAQFKSFKVIHISADNVYFNCDFYGSTNQEGQEEYKVVVETNKQRKSQHNFVHCSILNTWDCINPDALPSELIEKIMAQIETIAPNN
jgi:hypothetical protein